MIRNDLERMILLEQVTEWVTSKMLQVPKAGDLHPALIDVVSGRESDIEAVSGWFVKSGKQLTHPVECLAHQQW